MIYTIGHSYITAEEFASLLKQHGVKTLVDVRSLPGSRRSPQFNRENMEEWLPHALIRYRHLPAIGGRRRNQDADPTLNAGWENPSFKSYADYTLTRDYWGGLSLLRKVAHDDRVAIMCGEPVPWRCHRSILSNSLVAAGTPVSHIMPNGTLVEHTLGLYGAKPTLHDNGSVTYPKEEV